MLLVRHRRGWRAPTGGAAISCRIMVFAKAPTPGRVKTRLIPVLGEIGAAELQRQLIERTLCTAAAAGLGTPELWCAPGPDDLFLAACAERHGMGRQAQGDGDLGMRMARALEPALAAGSPGLLIGCDCPALTSAYLREAAAALLVGANDAVLGPAEDGGYVLIGLARGPTAHLFRDVAWGSETVMQETRARLARDNWRWRELPPLWDVDRPEDLRRLRSWEKRNRQGNQRLPATPPARGGGGNPAKPVLLPPNGKNSR